MKNNTILPAMNGNTTSFSDRWHNCLENCNWKKQITINEVDIICFNVYCNDNTNFSFLFYLARNLLLRCTDRRFSVNYLSSRYLSVPNDFCNLPVATCLKRDLQEIGFGQRNISLFQADNAQIIRGNFSHRRRELPNGYKMLQGKVLYVKNAKRAS